MLFQYLMWSDFEGTHTVYPKKYAHGFCFAVLCCGYTLTDFPISIRLTSLALWQSNDCPSASKATLMNMDKYIMWIHYERLHNHNKAKHNKTVCIFLGIYCSHNTVIMSMSRLIDIINNVVVRKSYDNIYEKWKYPIPSWTEETIFQTNMKIKHIHKCTWECSLMDLKIQ